MKYNKCDKCNGEIPHNENHWVEMTNCLGDDWTFDLCKKCYKNMYDELWAGYERNK